MRRGMYVYAWDLWHEGTAAVAGRLRDAGLNALSLATAYHAGKFLRPHGPDGKVWFPEDGTVYFRPDAARYGCLQPQAASMVAEYDALPALARTADDFHVTGWTVGLHNSRLGALHPDLCCQTPFGDPLINALCPSQPEVRRYLTALCLDTAAQPGIGEIAIETPGFQAYRHGHHHEFELIALTEAVETLLGTCFCPACLARAKAVGLHAEALALQARRADTVTSLVAEVRAALDGAVSLAVIPSVQTPNSLCWREGSDLAALAKVADRLEVPAYQTGPAAIAADMDQVRAAAGDAAAIGFILRPTWPHVTGPDDLAACVTSARAAGASQLSFYNYGHMRLQSLDWIAAAL